MFLSYRRNPTMSPHSTVQHFTPHATLAALGPKLQSFKLFSAVEQLVHIPQKSVRHKPVEKLYDAFITILIGIEFGRSP
jgi:hypothetical protein